MKKIALLTFGLLLAATPAFADAGVDQYSSDNAGGSAYNGSNVWSNNGGASDLGVGNSAGIINQNVNTGIGSNVGTATDVVISGGLATSGNGVDAVSAGSTADTDRQLSDAYLQQVSTGNTVGDAVNQSNAISANSGVTNIGVNSSQGIISQNVNTGIASNVASAVGITIH